MQQKKPAQQEPFGAITDPVQLVALNELGRSVNIVTTYGHHHPAADKAVKSTFEAVSKLLDNEKRLTLGSFNGVMTINETPVDAAGTLLKSLERRLVRLHITGLLLKCGITEKEIGQLAQLLSLNETSDFENGIQSAGFSGISQSNTSYQAVREGQTIADETALRKSANDGVLVLDDTDPGTPADSPDSNGVHVEQIVAFLKGDIDLDAPGLAENLAETAGDPEQLGRLIMESVAIRQSATNLSGESLGDIVIGCLRRTFDGLRKQPAFQDPDGVASLHKALLMLEKSVLEKMHSITGEDDPELDRQIVQAVRNMEEGLSFELAAQQYVGHQRGLDESRTQMLEFIKERGADEAEDLLEHTKIPPADWRRIVVQSHCSCSQGPTQKQPALDGLSTLTKVFDKLEVLMKSDSSDNAQMKNLLGEASDNLGDTIHSTREKLDTLSRQLQEAETGTIGGEGRRMTRKELLSSIAEVAQELMQPLTAIRASLEMLLEGYVGQVDAEQRDILSLAEKSTEHLRFLMNELINIVGLPANKGIDERFHTTSEQVALMKHTPST